METKRCKTCGDVKPLEDYYKKPTNKDGRQGSCRDCEKERRRLLKDNKVRTKFKNPYKRFTLKYDVFSYFARMDVRLDDHKIKSIIEELHKAEQKGTYFKELDALADKYKAKDYEDEFLEELREERMMQTAGRVKQKGRDSGQRISMYDLQGNYIRTFESLNEASHVVHGSSTAVSSIANCALGKFKQAIGYIWMYTEFDD